MARTVANKSSKVTSSTQSKSKGNVEMIYNPQNIIVSKEKNSDFLNYFGTNPVLSECLVNRVMDTGNYSIYFLDNVFEDQKNELRGHSKEWL